MQTTVKGLIMLLVLSASVVLHAEARQAIPVPAPDSLLMAVTGLVALAGAMGWKKLGK
jgi:hypothetical protein